MKYVVINGSPRKKNTWKVVKQVEQNLDGEFEEIHLAKENIPICHGCHNCIMEGEDKCPHFDIVNPIVEKLKNADGIIMTSPVYAMNVSALLKNFIDHTAYIFHRQEFFTQKALVIVTTAGAGHKKVSKYMDESLRHWGVNKVFKITWATGGEELPDIKSIDKTAIKFKKDVESGKLHSPKLGDIIFFDVWKAMAFKEDGIPADIRFWHETGLVNHDFGPEVKLGMVKKLFSKVMFKILKKVI
ncbi:MAG: NAD(P)H-dependent oxidoreductase [Methanobrevibacter sp.]|nr:NAD(P)H-dependent oxidoreductase [Methanobrevibacter sp.]